LLLRFTQRGLTGWKTSMLLRRLQSEKRAGKAPKAGLERAAKSF
jgi:hypothetical protein